MVRSQKIAGAGRHVTLYLDGEINLEVGVELETAVCRSRRSRGSATPAGAVASVVHFGPYDQLCKAHEAISPVGALDHGYTLDGPNWEIYGHWVDEWNTDPTKIRTDVFYLLNAAGKSAD